MTHSITPANDHDIGFAHDLTRDNMAGLYAAHGRICDRSIFESSWPETENFSLIAEGLQVGVLRLSQGLETLYVRDLQVLPSYQRRGSGTFAMKFVEKLSSDRRLYRIHLNVFEDNPALSWYTNMGYCEISAKHGLCSLERVVRASDG